MFPAACNPNHKMTTAAPPHHQPSFQCSRFSWCPRLDISFFLGRTASEYAFIGMYQRRTIWEYCSRKLPLSTTLYSSPLHSSVGLQLPRTSNMRLVETDASWGPVLSTTRGLGLGCRDYFGDQSSPQDPAVRPREDCFVYGRCPGKLT